MGYFKTVEIFLNKHGLSGLERMRSMCNKGYPLRDIAEKFKVSVPTAGRLRDSLFKCVYIVSEDVKNHLQYEKNRHSWASDQYKNEIEKTDEIECKILQLYKEEGSTNVIYTKPT